MHCGLNKLKVAFGAHCLKLSYLLYFTYLLSGPGGPGLENAALCQRHEKRQI